MHKRINHIVIKDKQARIKGKVHIKAEIVARMALGREYSIEDVMAQYKLTAAEVHAALVYYYDNQEALDEAYQGVMVEIQANAMTVEQFIKEIDYGKATNG